MFSADVTHRRGAFPDLDRVVLDPARLRQDLLVLELMAPDLGAVVVEDHAPGAGGALVDGGDELGQLAAPLLDGSIVHHGLHGPRRSPTLTACPAAGRTHRAWTGCCRPTAWSTSTATTSTTKSRKRSVIRALEWTGEVFGNTEKFARIALDEVADVPDPKILELGAGHGGLSRKLLEWHPTAELTVTDVEAASVQAIAAGDLGEHPRATVREMDATAIDAADRHFDLAVFALSFHHLPPSLASQVIAEGTRAADQAADHRPAAAAVAAAPRAAGDDAAVRAVDPVRARRRDQLAAHLQPVGAARAGRARRPVDRHRAARRADEPAGRGGQPPLVQSSGGGGGPSRRHAR